MTRLNRIFRAGCTLRWHTNPDLVYTGDRVDSHSARVARIILALHPDPSLLLLRAALTHDDGEAVVGDVSFLVKKANPKIAEELQRIEAAAVDWLWGWSGLPLVADDADWLEFADRLDAYMWAKFHAPQVLSGDGWPEYRKKLLRTADTLGCFGDVAEVLG